MLRHRIGGNSAGQRSTQAIAEEFKQAPRQVVIAFAIEP
jgi:hypothetical protein